jgi:hypothetical protein
MDAAAAAEVGQMLWMDGINNTFTIPGIIMSTKERAWGHGSTLDPVKRLTFFE